jgi:lysophospholipase L1-like esterase
MIKVACLSVVTFLLATGSASAQISATASPSPASITADQLTRLTNAENKLKDWPNLGRYRDANAKVAPPAKGEDRVVFMGDSITDGWKLDQYFAGKPYINRGISGQTTPQMLIRFRPDVIALEPKVVVILAGTNDLAGNTGPMTVESIEDNLRTMAELAMVHNIRVVFASILPISDYSKNKDGATVIRSTGRPPDKIIAINQWMKKFAEDNNQVYLDYFSAVVDAKGFLKEELSRDGLHPNAQGYDVMKPLAEAAIEQALKQRSDKKNRTVILR